MVCWFVDKPSFLLRTQKLVLLLFFQTWEIDDYLEESRFAILIVQYFNSTSEIFIKFTFELGCGAQYDYILLSYSKFICLNSLQPSNNSEKFCRKTLSYFSYHFSWNGKQYFFVLCKKLSIDKKSWLYIAESATHYINNVGYFCRIKKS